MNILVQDIRFALRMLRKHRLATLVLVLALALGIGPNTAIFSVAEAFLFRPLPLPHIDRLAALMDSRPQQNFDQNPIAPATYLEWKQQIRSYDELAAYVWNQINLTGDREPQKIQAFSVSSNFFHLMDVYPEIDRAFSPEQEPPAKQNELILRPGLWERHYVSAPNILGKPVKVDGLPHPVVGVMPKGSPFPSPAEAWVPLALTTAQTHLRDRRFI